MRSDTDAVVHAHPPYCTALANHGTITTGETSAKAMWCAVELEMIAKQYGLNLALGGPVFLDDAQIEETFAGYGLRD